MIIGLILRNFKVYKNIQYIPLSTGSNFNGLIGMNGIGKSSTLEALDCFFNKKPWIVNIDNSNLSESWVMPVIALKKSDFDLGEMSAFATKITEYVLSEELPTDSVSKKNYGEHIEKLKASIPTEVRNDYYIIPICLDGFWGVNWGIFNYSGFKNKVFEEGTTDEKQNEMLESLYGVLTDLLTYVYVPKDIEHTRFVAFENQDMQRLIGKNLTEIVSSSLTTTSIQKISSDLKHFIGELSGKLKDYKFRASSSYQPNLKPQKIYDLIIDEFFSLRCLYKDSEGKDIPLAQLSSGEKQQAIIKVITRLVSSYRESNKGLIVAVDEPESSLHVSLCYEQFEKLYNISLICNQVLFTSHWYGFIPTLTNGSIVNISNDGKYEFNIFNAENYREEIKHADTELKGKLPIDVMVKSSNDLVQSILSSIVRDDCYNWLICEGSSDKIYLNAYFEDEIRNKRLRIIPVCKASEVKKMYEHLSLAIDELKGNVKGRIFMLTDTDAQLLTFKTNDGLERWIRCNRIVNEGETTKLVRIESNPKSPKTDIEDALNGKLFNEILLNFKEQNEELSFLSEEEKPETSSASAMDMRQSEYEKMDEFFSKNNGENKVAFANAYILRMKEGDYKVPEWIEEIKSFFA